MNVLERLEAIEEIKRLKARYCRAVDERRFDEWRDIFVPDAVALAPEIGEDARIIGVEAMIKLSRTMLEGATTVHHLHSPEIELLSADQATGIWAMEDNIYWAGDCQNAFGAERHFRGMGHYREKYGRTANGWRITEMTLTRLYMECDGVATYPFRLK